MIGIWALKPYYLGPWTLKGMPAMMRFDFGWLNLDHPLRINPEPSKLWDPERRIEDFSFSGGRLCGQRGGKYTKEGPTLWYNYYNRLRVLNRRGVGRVMCGKPLEHLNSYKP